MAESALAQPVASASPSVTVYFIANKDRAGMITTPSAFGPFIGDQALANAKTGLKIPGDYVVYAGGSQISSFNLSAPKLTETT